MRPSANFIQVIPRNAAPRPLAGIPATAPLCVPRADHRTTACSPSATTSSTVTRKSGNAPSSDARIVRNCEGPCASAPSM